MIITVDNNTIIFTILILFSGIIGYLLGQKNGDSGVFIDRKSSIVNKQTQKHQTIQIDETKHVSDIKTSDLEKKYSSLGDTQLSNDNISSSINKLKNMKG